MNQVRQKREVGILDGTPDKRMYWSLISDYDIKSGVCELIDNAIDLWIGTNRKKHLTITLTLDPERQLIRLQDNAGGVREEDLRLLIAPGASSNSPDAETIGIFGVGSKRAVVALAESATIRTRRGNANSFQIDITHDWLESPDWDIPHFEIPAIETGATIVELSALRKPLEEADIDHMRLHIAEVYSSFLKASSCNIVVNDTKIRPLSFDTWAYPPGFEPRSTRFVVTLPGLDEVKVKIVAGLIRDRDPVYDNYGVYFYCNERLVVKELRTREVGYFVSSEAGVPHPDASLCRVIVRMQGAAKLMPWNSTKSGINAGHPLFHSLRPTVIQLVSHFSSLSRRLKNDWDTNVLQYTHGTPVQIAPVAADRGKRLVLPPLPKVNKPHSETLKARNRTQIDDQPWTAGLVEAMAAVDVIVRQKLDTKNRIALILLDSNFEIALKEFIVHRDDLFPPRQFNDAAIRTLFENRRNVIDAVSKAIAIPPTVLAKAKHFYGLRNKLIHERATVGITDSDVDNYRATIEKTLKLLFGLRF